MSVHRTASAETGPAPADPPIAEVYEIYPGALTGAPFPTTPVPVYPIHIRPRRRFRARMTGAENGMATAEYAIATLAAVGFAGALVFIMRSDEVRGFLLNLIRTALALP